MFNLWKRTYVHTITQRSFFDSKAILAVERDATTIIPLEAFREGGTLVCQEESISEVLNKHYDGQISSLFVDMLAGDGKWAIVVDPSDYYYVLGCYLKEVQHSFKISDEDMQLVSFSYPYDNFYYSAEPIFIDMFLDGTAQEIMQTAMTTHAPTGVLDLLNVSDLPTEIGYFLLSRELATQDSLIGKFKNAAQLVVSRLQQAHDNDLSEWCVLNTRQFLNLIRVQDAAEVNTADFSFAEFGAFVKSDPNLNAMLLNYMPLANPGVDWSLDSVKTAAADVIEVWERLFLFQHVSELRRAQSGDDRAQRRARRYADNEADSTNLKDNLEWLTSVAEANADSAIQHTDLAIRYDRIRGICDAIKFLLELRDAPLELTKPLIKLLGYDILSEAMNSKYNKTLLLLAVNTPASTFKRFAAEFFGPQSG